jgi:hypothetical protein
MGVDHVEEDIVFNEDDTGWIDSTCKEGRGLHPMIDEYKVLEERKGYHFLARTGKMNQSV